MLPIKLVTIKSKSAVQKRDKKTKETIFASSIELLKFNENMFEVISGIDNFQVGDQAVYIQPDYCVEDNVLFHSYVRPHGDSNKSLLGKNNRIRAAKFTWREYGSPHLIYSNGILLSVEEVKQFLGVDELVINEEMVKKIGITKYVEEDNVVDETLKDFPVGISKTGEENIKNVGYDLDFPIRLIGTKKIDGNSITIGKINGREFICLRNQELILDNPKTWNRLEYKVAKPYLDYIKTYSEIEIVVRGELNGLGVKGADNGNNPDRLEPTNIKFFNVEGKDSTGVLRKLDRKSFEGSLSNFNFVIKNKELDLTFEKCPVIFNQVFNSYDELMDFCKGYFKTNKIEGIVVQNFENTFSAKIMNNEYDSKK